jgi:hypothetical protein
MQYRVIWLVVFGLLSVHPARADEGNISPTDRYARSEHTGGLNFRPTHGGVTIYPDHLEGYAWAENVGGIHVKNTNPAYAYTVEIAGADDVELVKTQDVEIDRGSDPATRLSGPGIRFRTRSKSQTFSTRP